LTKLCEFSPIVAPAVGSLRGCFGRGICNDGFVLAKRWEKTVWAREEMSPELVRFEDAYGIR
jgi:hypothetical protein